MFFCCYKARNAELQKLRDDIDELRQANFYLTDLSDEISDRYSAIILKTYRQESVISAQKEDIRALEQIVSRPKRDAFTQTD